jgi:gluconate 2-dehydrogenase gamma chain
MSDKCQTESTADRHDLLKLIGVAGAAVSRLPLSDAASAELSADHKAHDTASAAGSRAISAGYEFFNTNESAFIESAVDTLIPADPLVPGAAELGVGPYIDRQMAGGYGKDDQLYLKGPFGENTAQQGYQLPTNPSELIRVGIAAVNNYTKKQYQKTFAALSAEDRLRVMLDLAADKLSLPSLPAEAFFGLLLQLTIEGYLADSMHGDNNARASWKMIGFPGATRGRSPTSLGNEPCTAQPMGI